ncbi:DUF6448 family protein [Desulfoferrobacter suflitae]|uniref:DUF6448 family protein n=1 Tax=Desulfoferrobacter suflitae TaxID=2865782 RepID=UPI002164841F|nr:DUF6448 family protein [Desulfoferrobacter suflitae]MCK8604299.1 DUF6448 family protein [Desulfoferrobacter suflitae]
MKNKLFVALSNVFIVLSIVTFAGAAKCFAHCDTMDGPVVKAAKEALETENVDPVLIWVQEGDEVEIKRSFQETLAVRKLGPKAEKLADRYFFEKLVRIHRAGEGAPYTGLKPAGMDLDPAVKEADRALEKGSADQLVTELTNNVATGVRERFHQTVEKKKHAGDSLEAGREFVASYVEFVHYVERLHLDAAGLKAHHSEAETGKAETEHQHN